MRDSIVSDYNIFKSYKNSDLLLDFVISGYDTEIKDIYGIIKSDLIVKLLTTKMIFADDLFNINNNDSIIDEYILNLFIWKLYRLGESIVQHKYITENYLPIIIYTIKYANVMNLKLHKDY